ncbi:hypothetical protein [Sulfuricella sp. T08]|uniref:hypothetical protein n=1 Tax=Sulfuricella sp. T08 TaxID=1632857 RepID=UPI000750A4FB|nr:hypothetical protein [Sulfuricella sp. T08]
MRQGVRIAAAVIAILFWVGASAASLEEKFQPGAPYYFENFDPAMKPWDPGQDLNLEEVFKNYVYYEIIFDKSGREITVNHYLQNRKERSDRFLIRPDRSLEAK